MPDRPHKMPPGHRRAKDGEMRDRVVGYLRDHPQASSGEIGAALNVSAGYVRAALRRCGIKLARARVGE